MLPIITRAITLPVGIEIDAGHDLGLEITLCEDDAHALVIGRSSLEGIGGAGTIVKIALIIVDLSIAHDLLHFGLRDFAALHATLRMLSIFYVGYPSVEAAVSIDLRSRIGRLPPIAAGGRINGRLSSSG